MLKTKNTEKAKGQEVENSSVVKTRRGYYKKEKNKYNNKRK